jgi:hypothetical protein
MIGWIEEKYPEYVDEGSIVNITVEQYYNPCFFQNKCIKYWVYSGINTSIIKEFLASQKVIFPYWEISGCHTFWSGTGRIDPP